MSGDFTWLEAYVAERFAAHEKRIQELEAKLGMTRHSENCPLSAYERMSRANDPHVAQMTKSQCCCQGPTVPEKIS